jgi:hypothetical protein
MSQRHIRLSRDTFWFPYSCRRDHTAHLRTLLLGFALVFAGGLLLPSPSLAGDIEADVIDATTDPLFEEESWADIEASTWDGWVIDAADIYDDTEYGTDCSTYAAVNLSYLDNMRSAFADLENRTYEWDVAMYLSFSLPHLNYLCAEE